MQTVCWRSKIRNLRGQPRLSARGLSRLEVDVGIDDCEAVRSVRKTARSVCNAHTWWGRLASPVFDFAKNNSIWETRSSRARKASSSLPNSASRPAIRSRRRAMTSREAECLKPQAPKPRETEQTKGLLGKNKVEMERWRKQKKVAMQKNQ